MALSPSKKNVPFAMAMTLTLVSLIAPADAQTTCTSSSPQCCWVVESWKKMGKTTSVDPTSATACCSEINGTPQISEMPVVKCTSSGIVTLINWKSKSLNGSIPEELGNLTSLWRLWLDSNKLTGSIPSSIGNLVNLKELWLYHNQLTGSIPSSLGNLVNLKEFRLESNQLSGSIPSSLGFLTSVPRLRFEGNTGLNGTFTPQCTTSSGVKVSVFISNTGIILCGCLAASTPPTIFPPNGTHADCLASGPALTLAKRTQASGQVIAEIGGRRYTCHVDSTNQNPFADCTNSMAFLCNTSDTTWNSDEAKRERCRTAVNQMYGQMNSYWQEVRKHCGQWSWNSSPAISAAASSNNCADANTKLIANAYYNTPIGKVYVTPGFTISQNDGLWSKVTEQ